MSKHRYRPRQFDRPHEPHGDHSRSNPRAHPLNDQRGERNGKRQGPEQRQTDPPPGRDRDEDSPRGSPSSQDPRVPDERQGPSRQEDRERASQGAPPAEQKQPPPRAKQEEDESPAWYQRPWIVGSLIVVLIAAIIGGVLWYLHARRYESTDDAYIDIQSEHVSPQVAGRVMRVLVNDNQDVKAGEVLVEIDPADYQAALNRALAAVAQARGQLATAQSDVLLKEAQLQEARANVIVAEANATNTSTDLQRYQQLRQANPGAVSQQQLDKATAAAKSNTAQLEAANKSVSAAQAQVESAHSQVQAAQAAVRSAEAQVEQARLNLSYTQVKARLDGRVAQKTVAAGNYVQPGVEMMAIVPPDVYVTANFKESQLNTMRPGQLVSIKVDAYPQLQLHGHVDSIQPGTGQAFSMLPAQNATGNWVKIVQRVPVKIVFDQIPGDPNRLAPGMSVEIEVQVK